MPCYPRVQKTLYRCRVIVSLCLLSQLFACESLTREEQEVYVNAVDAVDEVTCTWGNSQYFDVTDGKVNVRARILPYGHGPDMYTLTVLFVNTADVTLDPESVLAGISSSDGKGHDVEFELLFDDPAILRKVPNDAGNAVYSWLQDFDIVPGMPVDPNITYYLTLDVSYTDPDKQVHHMHARLPLRRVKITIATSIV